eukprot:6207237-Pleurochrysis_carterae.AAC.2
MIPGSQNKPSAGALLPPAAAANRSRGWSIRSRALADAFFLVEHTACLHVPGAVPADARIVEMLTTTFSTDEGSLTGESATVSKTLQVTTAAHASASRHMCLKR